MKNNIALILGAKSDIAMAAAHRFARGGYNIQLAARNVDNLLFDKSDIELRHSVSVSLHEFDVLDIHAYVEFVRSLPELPSVALVAVGFIGEQQKSESDVHEAATVIRTNYEGPANILSILANEFEKRGSGYLIGISSVAGERGRASNYIYGSAKAGFTSYLSGLRNRLSTKGVSVLTVLPGFVYTKMTENMKLPRYLTAYPDDVASAIFNAYLRNKQVLYVKPIWKYIMLIIKIIPEKIFSKLNL